MSQRETSPLTVAQERELEHLQTKIAAVQAQTAVTMNELVQTQARTIVLEDEIASQRDELMMMRIRIMLREMEVQHPTTPWEEQAHFIHDTLPQMHFRLAASTVVSIWFEDDPDGENILRLDTLLTTIYGAYHTLPITIHIPDQPNLCSFGFSTNKALEDARQVFPFPAELESGPPISLFEKEEL